MTTDTAMEGTVAERATLTDYGTYNLTRTSHDPASQQRAKRLPCPSEVLELAGVEHGRVIVGWVSGRSGNRPRYDGWLFDTDWEERVTAVPDAHALLDELSAARSEQARARQAARLRKQNAARTTYGQLVLALAGAQSASSKAKTYPRKNRQCGRLYAKKQAALVRAGALAASIDSFVWGWKIDGEDQVSEGECWTCDGDGYCLSYDDHQLLECDRCHGTGDYVRVRRALWVVYFELPQGQVSFHSPTRGSGPDYPGEWDGTHTSQDRITEALATFGPAPRGIRPVTATEAT